MKRSGALAIVFWGACLAPAAALVQSGALPSGGIYQIVGDTLDGSAANPVLTAAGGNCATLCMAGSLGQVASSSAAAAGAPARSVGAGYFDFQYNYERLLVLLPGESLYPGSATGKYGRPSSVLIDTPFDVSVYGTDRAWNVASTATATVQLSTSGFATMSRPLVSGAAAFSNAVFTTSGTARMILAQGFGAPASFSSGLRVLAPTASSPTVTIDIANDSLQTTLGGAITGAASDLSGVAQVQVSLQRVGNGQWFNWTTGAFDGGTAAPVSTSAVLSASGELSTKWSVAFADTNLFAGEKFYAVVVSSNASNNQARAASTFTFTPGTLYSGRRGDGEGAASVTFNSDSGCQVMVASMAFTAGPAGIAPGGSIALHIPDNWQAPSGIDLVNNPPPMGYVWAGSSSAFSLDIIPSGQEIGGTTFGNNWLHYQSIGGLNPGQQVWFTYHGFVGGGPLAVGPQVFATQTKATSNSLFKSLASQPSAPLLGGIARSIQFTDQQSLKLGPLQPSPTMQLSVFDNCGTSTVTLSAVTINLMAGRWGNIDHNATFYASAGSALGVNPDITLLPGQARSPSFYYTTSTGATVSSELVIATAVVNGRFSSSSRYVQLLGSVASISAVSIDTGTLTANVRTATMTGNSFQSPAVINFKVSDSNLGWEIIISTSNVTYTPELVHRYGVGQPGRTQTWSGLNEREYPQSFVPPGGPYYVKIIVGGGVVQDATLAAFVAPSASIYGTVNSSGAYAYVQANGPGTSYGNFAVASSTGFFQIYGLRAGQAYNISATTSTVLQGQFLRQTSSSFNVTAANGGYNLGAIPFPQVAILRVRVQIPSAAPKEFFGGLTVHTPDYSQSSYGTLHFSSGSDKSDDGNQSFGRNASTWTVLGLLPGTYALDVNLQQIGISSSVSNVVVAGSGTTDVVISVSRVANVYGYVTVPSTTVFGTFASVQAQKAGESRPSRYGSAFLQGSQPGPAQSSNTYSLFGLDPGTWTISARAYGFASASTSVFISSSADIGAPNGAAGLMLALGSGGVLNGVVNLVGDSTLLPAQNYSQNGLDITINAYNSQTHSNGFARVHVSTSATLASSTFSITGLENGTYYLSTFVSGAQAVNVSTAIVGGVGNTTLTLPVNNARLLLTFKLPGAKSPSEYSNVSYFTAGESRGSSILQDLTAGTTLQYFVSSATLQSGPLAPGYVTFSAFYNKTGAYQSVRVALTQGATARAVLDLTGSTFTVSGSVVLGTNVGFTPGGASVSVSSIPGVLAYSGSALYCLMGSTVAVAASAFHLELLPVSQNGGSFMTQALLTQSNVGGDCGAPRAGFPGDGGINPFLAYIAAINPDGSFVIPNVPAGSYVLRVPTDLDFDGNPNSGELPSIRQFVTVSTTTSGLTFSLGKGVSIKGKLLMPPGIAGSRSFQVSLLDGSNILKQSIVNFDRASAADYSLDHVPDGNFSLRVTDFSFPISFGAKPLALEVAGVDMDQDIQLLQTGIIKGKMAVQQNLPGSATPQTLLITADNVRQLPRSFRIYAEANPWFDGGNAYLGSGVALDANDQFVIVGVLPGLYDVRFESYNDPNDNSTLRLVRSFSPGVQVDAGRTTDIGTVNLTAALQVRGTVYDITTSSPIANISLSAKPAIDSAGGNDMPSATTDADGRYALVGLDPAVKLYDIYAAYRGERQDSSIPPYELKIAPAVDVTSGAVVDFRLVPAGFTVSGKIVGADGGPGLSQPFNNHNGAAPPAGAVVFLQKINVVPHDNPISDIQVPTDASGNFAIPALTAGSYRLTAVSLGYASAVESVVISTGSVDVGTIVLGLGASLSGNILKPDGSSPSQRELDTLVAVTNNFNEVLIGNLVQDPNTKTVTGYSVSGFLPGLSYRLLLFGEGSSFVSPAEAQDITFSTTTESSSLDIVMRPSAPFAFAKARKSNGVFNVSFDLSQPLRAKTPLDDDLAAILSTFGSAGALSQIELSATRSQLTGVYTPAVGESSFTLKLSALSTITDPESLDPVNPQFVYDSTFTFFTGVDGFLRNTLSNFNGGTLLVEGDNGRVTIPSGAFAVDASSSVEVSLAVSQEPLSGASVSGLRGAAANISALRYSGGAYPQDLLKAMAATPPQVSPFSGFYNILLPLGVRTALQKPVQMTISFSTGTDPTALNLYWYNAAANAYILQQDVLGQAPVIDYDNHTITINVNHFSTFVMFNTGVAVITGNVFNGDFAAYNFPNPFDLSAKTVSPIHGPGNQTVRGTMISISLPPDISGDASIKIFNVAGERVRTISLGTLAGGSYFYQPWDGRNDSGRDVASGVYIGQVKVGDRSKFFKMALIK